MTNLANLKKDIQKHANPKRANDSMYFFKTEKGQYGAHDIFLGLTVPESRILAKNYSNLSLAEITELLHSKYHEERLVALLLLMQHFKLGENKFQKQIYDMYISNTKYINNWDLVDVSAAPIVGTYLLNKDKKVLIQLSKSKDLWEKRIAMIATHAFIRNGDYKYTFAIAEILLHDKHDLIHKAVGWSLREVGKKIGHDVEEKFLKAHYRNMPRTALRYAIEHFSPAKKKFYMTKGDN
jgi:3-methyladenine DNA glycosylase AlkD